MKTKTNRATKKTTNTVVLVDGPGRRVSFTTEKGGGAMMQNSLALVAELSLEDASEMIARLLTGGWTVELAA